MNNVEQLNNFLQRVTADKNLTTIHIGICTALMACWIKNNLNNPFNVSRRILMEAARVKSKTTYHRVITELTALKYVTYEPSYHPGKGSRVCIL